MTEPRLADAEPTTKAEREQRREFLNSPALQHNPLPSVEWELRLIADVERLEAEVDQAEVKGYALWLHADRHAEPECKRCKRFFDVVSPKARALELRHD